MRRGDPRVLARQIEVVGIGMLNPALLARLIRQPEKEFSQLGERGVYRRLAQPRAGPLASLARQMPLKRDRLLMVEYMKALVPVEFFKAAQRLRSGIDRRLGALLCFFEPAEIPSLDSLVFWVVLDHC